MIKLNSYIIRILLKINILVTFIILSINLVHGQSKFQPSFYFGINQGVNFSKVYFDPSINQNFLRGYSGGLVFQYISEPHFGIQMELNYTQKGWTEQLQSPNSYTRKLSYIEVPFLAHAQLGGGNSKLTIDMGPFISNLLSQNEKTNITDETLKQPYFNKKIDRNFGYGVCVGIGFMEKTPIGIFEIGCRYNHTLSYIFNTDFAYMSMSQNQVFSISLKYLVKL